jgi:NADPH:quinone reductase-like Zn-dependent oxidoreductase
MKVRAGEWKGKPVPLPSGIGVEAAGVVDEVGDGTVGVSIGDAVFGYGRNTMAHHAVLTNWARKPGDMPFDEAGAMPVVVETATRILTQVGGNSGETLLVNGAAGGIGSAVLQLARRRGMIVIGTADIRKHDYLRALGAIPTTYGAGLVERVRKLAPAGVQGALDLAGSGVTLELIELVGDPSHVVSIVDFNASRYGARGSFEVQDYPERALAEVAKLYSAGAFRLTLEKTFPLARVAEAYALSAAGHVTGKLVITVS